jgi:alkanesulfonate monooxygenase SsuD/methylene tetrahydromethanopterin reductase-like flavin-dependent oxidoreductase (luciferase family)
MGEKMKFHWMLKKNINPKELKTLSKVIDFYKYDSVLLTFSSEKSDYWIKAAHAINIEDKIKYMIAVRPYTITAGYCSMMIYAFHEIEPNRLSLNIVAGTYDDEQAFFCIPTSIKDRKEQSGLFAEKLRSINENCPEIFFSGSSKETVENVSKFGDGQIVTLSQFNRNKVQSKRTMVRLLAIIDDNAKFIYDGMPEGQEKSNTIFGNKKEIKNQIKQLESHGVTDILISNTSFGSNDEDIHQVVLEIIGENNV